MNKAAIKTFAIDARNQLIADVSYLAEGLGIGKDKIVAASVPAPGVEKITLESGEIVTLQDTKIKQRHSLLSRIEEVGYDQVIEEVAYTWFNRLIAVRFMEVHGYLPIRVLSSSTGKEESDLISQAPDVDFGFTSQQISEIYELKDRNKIDELFKILFIRQCNVLNDALPGMFQKTEDYTELLFPLQYTNPNGVIRKLLSSISEEDFSSVEIIGWMYQYYNSELKDDTFARLKKNQKITKERIPSATQLFTPEWIVRYMVENSLGRLWYEGHPDDALKSTWKYYLDEAKQEPEVEAELRKIRKERSLMSPEDITFIDPCMGSGHILVYAFDVLMQIYESAGYQKSVATKLILEKNLFGLDIDDRAGQLAYFAVMMKAREYNRKIFDEHIKPHLCSIQESNIISDELLSRISNGDSALYQSLVKLKNIFIDAKEYGSILIVPESIDFARIEKRLAEVASRGFARFDSGFKRLIDVINQGVALSRKYDAVVTNPPYMGGSGMTTKLSNFVKRCYPNSRTDLFAVFIERGLYFTKTGFYLSMITQHAWMTLSSYESLRKKLINYETINMVHLGAHAFDEIGGEIVQTTAFVKMINEIENYSGLYQDLREGISENNKCEMFLSKCNTYVVPQKNFKYISGDAVAYWISPKLISAFNYGKNILEYVDTFQGIITGDNIKFLRYWFEVSSLKIPFHENCMKNIDLNEKYWIPYNKGGNFRKWYGEQDYVINWKNGPEDKTRGKKSFSTYYLREYVAWSYTVSPNAIATRYYPPGFLWDVRGSGIMDKADMLYYLEGLISSKVGYSLFRVTNLTLTCQVENISKFPIYINANLKNKVDNIVINNNSISKLDWDSFETSWDFQTHPFISHKGYNIKESFENWKNFASQQFAHLKVNEEELNKLFIEIYGLQDELTPNIYDDDITINHADLTRDVKSFLSYAVGCMFGRYSLDTPGLVYAGGDFDPTKYQLFPADDDGIIPINDREYFEDDIVGRFIEFLKVTYGENTLEENLAFIAGALKTKGNTPRESIRNYFLKDFYADHLKIYQKRPIYWLFDSGKQNGFKALIYLHRYNRDTVGRVRTDYLHETQKKIEAAIERAEYFKANGTPVQQRKATDEISTLTKQLEETKKYDEALATIALQRIELDFDDGVKVNYEKFQNVDVGGEGKMKKTIDLLGKIK